jgi:hypothetical protein
MKSVLKTLKDTDAALYPILAKRWNVNITKAADAEEITQLLSDAMLDPARVEKAWESLDDRQRGALQMLLGSGGKMPTVKFERLFGEIREMGAAAIEREKPHENPVGPAEALYYRGLVAQGFEYADTGARGIVYVPDDLRLVLPTHKTAYANLEEVPAVEAERGDLTVLEEVENIQPANTSIVDDLTTLLAYWQLYSAAVDGEILAQTDREAVMPYLLTPDFARLDFLYGLALSADLVEIQNGKVYPKRAEARRWLSASRAAQVKQLAEAWKSSAVFRDLWHVPGLYPEPTGWPYDPVVARGAVMGFLEELAPAQEWWSLEEFIGAVKDDDPDFQRPGGDYNSWYIRNDEGEYLNGFESWDAVEGALLEYYIIGPMHWLGLVDMAEDAARLTAYGRAFLGSAAWPNQPDPEDKITVQADGTLLISRKIPRIDRFQAARFTTWQGVGDPYIYKIDAASIERAGQQGINTGHIASFITRAIGEGMPIPAALAQLLDNWKSGPTAAVTLEQVTVLRTTAPETLDRILDTPALRRYLGARLGPMAVIVRSGEVNALRGALTEQGIQAEMIG